MFSKRSPKAWLRAGALGLLLATTGCGGGAKGSPSDEAPAALPPLKIAVMMSPSPGQQDGEADPSATLPDISWALDDINNAGGVAGHKLEVEYFDPSGQDLAALASQIIADGSFVAAIAPPGSAGLEQVADLFVDAKMPLVSPTSTSDELLRAYGGKGAIWRTRQSDIAQTELLLRFAQQQGKHKVALITSLDSAGSTFFRWFAFFAQELGFADDKIKVVTLDSNSPCDQAVSTALAWAPEMLFVAAGAPEQLTCIAGKATASQMMQPPPGPGQGPPPAKLRVVFADTGLDPYTLETLGHAAFGVEGFSSAGSEAYEQAFHDRFPDAAHIAPHGASEHDAILLLAYGLEASKGQGGSALIKALEQVVSGTEEGPSGWDQAAIGDALQAIANGQQPALEGATGKLKFDPTLYMDLTSSTLTHWTLGDQGVVNDKRYSTGDGEFLSANGPFVKPQAPPKTSGSTNSTWQPTTPRSDTWAVVAALSDGWSNYRHQSDALQQYQLLRSAGVPDDHIVLMLADDLAESSSNPLQGTVRNEPDGSNVRADAQVDYKLTLTADDLENILSGKVTERTPTVLNPTEGSNVYVYLAGHGGDAGMPMRAESTEAGLDGGDDVFAPASLRRSLCSLKSAKKMRRALVVIESCYSGVFGEAASGGLEQGCDGDSGTQPLEGVFLLTAASSKEVSFAGSYDSSVRSWVNDSFSRQVATRLLGKPDVTVSELYVDAYSLTAGSHPSIYNLSGGQLSAVKLNEFFSP